MFCNFIENIQIKTSAIKSLWRFFVVEEKTKSTFRCVSGNMQRCICYSIGTQRNLYNLLHTGYIFFFQSKFCFNLWEISTRQIYELRNLIRKFFWRAQLITGHRKSHSNLHTRNFRYVSYFLSSHGFLVFVGFRFIRMCFIVVTNTILQGLFNCIQIFSSHFNGTGHFIRSQHFHCAYPSKK